VRAIVTDRARPAHLQETLRAAYGHLLLTEHQPEGRETAALAPVVRQGADPLEVMDDFLAYVAGGDVEPAEHAVLDGAYREVRARQQDASGPGTREADGRRTAPRSRRTVAS